MKIKGIVAFIFTLIVICCITPNEAQAASLEDLVFTLHTDSNSYYVAGCDQAAAGKLDIPAAYNDLPVTGIENSAFYNCNKLSTITVPNSIISIGTGAFDGCTNLISVTLSDKITSIRSYTFNNCKNLSNVTIPTGVTTIGSKAFCNCDSLTSVIIPDSVTQISNEAFRSCSSLTDLTIGCGVTDIGYYAFDDCALLNVYISDLNAWCNISFYDGTANPLRYAKNLYLNNELITDLVIPDHITSISDYAFYGYPSLSSVTIPGSVSIIREEAFRSCSNLTDVTISDGVTQIYSNVFFSCQKLYNVTIPSSVTLIGVDAFMYCDNLTNVYITDVANWCKIDFRSVYANPVYYAENLYLNGSKVTDLIIPNGVTKISMYAFNWFDSLNSVTIADSVTSIAKNAFYYCKGLTDVYYEGSRAGWNAISIGTNNDTLIRATLHFTQCEANGHSFDEVTASCHVCAYTRLTGNAISLNVYNKLVVDDKEITNTQHRAVVYYLGEQTVTDITDENSLKSIDPHHKTHWGLNAINKLQLQENGNYVVHIHYSEGTGIKQTVAKAFNICYEKPTVSTEQHKVVVNAGDDICTNYRATVYYLGNQIVENISDEAALNNLDTNAKIYWGLKSINNIQLLQNGNYVILLHYNIGTGAKQTVAKAVTRDLDEVTLEVADGKLVAADPGSNYLHHRAVVYYLGEETSVENAITAKTYWNLSAINKVQLTQPGNYVILLHYNLANSTKMTVTAQVTI